MLVVSILLVILIYRTYLFYKKQKDHREAALENQRIYLKEFFQQHFYFYTLLDEEEKQEFITRSINIRKNIEYYSIDDFLISENIKILISAAFTQITFGFESFQLHNFNRIFLHPSVFYSRWVGRDVKGLTFNNGIIHWSWEDFASGYMFDNDKTNLALHELAHALQIEFYENDETDTPEYEAWKGFATIETEQMKSDPENSYLRKYASTNIHEFFAVSIEYFFEDAIQFRAKLPQLYSATCKLLMQDMAARMERKLIPR